MCENWFRYYLPCGCFGYTTRSACSDALLICDRKPYDPGYSRKPCYEIFERKPPLQIPDEKYKRKLSSATVSEFEASQKKQKPLLDDEDEIVDNNDDNCDTQAWLTKPVKSWTLLDTKNWLYLTSQEMGLLYREISPSFARPGEELVLLSRRDFANMDRNFGEMLYDSLHQILGAESSFGCSEDSISLKPVSEIKVEPRSDEETHRDSVYSFPEEESLLARYQSVKQRSEESPRKNTSRRTSTRTSSSTRTNVRTSGLKIWEFIRNLLLDPKYCPSWIRWENYDEKTFRFIENEKIARLWGARNRNKKMNYRDFSRAMRYHYRMNKLAIVRPPRKLVYKFGPEANGLETDNPNFFKSIIFTQSQKDE